MVSLLVVKTGEHFGIQVDELNMIIWHIPNIYCEPDTAREHALML